MINSQEPLTAAVNLTETDIYPGDAADGSTVHGASERVRVAAERHGWRVLAILSALMGFASISTDLYLPAMPAMGRELNATTGMIEWTVSAYLIGFSLGQLIWGPIGDRFGRRLPVSLGLILFIIGSAGCALSHSGLAIIAWRIVQAVGACASVVLARAMVRDLYAGDRAAQMMSTLITVMAIAPLLGPMVGGQILLYAGWRAIFWTLVGVGVVTLGALMTLPETLPAERRNRESPLRALARYSELIGNRKLLGYAGAGGFFYAGVYAYIAGTPFAYITYYHVPISLYGVLFAVGILGIMATNLLNVRLVPRLSSSRVLGIGAWIAALSGIILALGAITGWGGFMGLIIPLFLFIGVSGFIVANSIAGALSDYPEHAGIASALVGAIHYGSGIIGSALVGAMFNGTPQPMMLIIALCGIGTLICVRSTRKYR